MYTLDIIVVIAWVYGLVMTIALLNLNDDETDEEKREEEGHAYQ